MSEAAAITKDEVTEALKVLTQELSPWRRGYHWKHKQEYNRLFGLHEFGAPDIVKKLVAYAAQAVIRTHVRAENEELQAALDRLKSDISYITSSAGWTENQADSGPCVLSVRQARAILETLSVDEI